MTLQRTLFNTFQWIGLILFLLSLGTIRAAQAGEIMLSDLPITDVLQQIEGYHNLGDPPPGPVEFDFTVVNDTPQEVFWYFKSEVLDPLAFSFYIQEQAEPLFLSPFYARTQKSHASQGPVLRSGLVVMAPGKRLKIRAVFEHAPTTALFPISLLSQDMNDAQDLRRSLTHGMFFGASVIFVFLFLLAPNFLLNAASHWFGIYLLSMALLNMHSHGYGLTFFDLTPQSHFPITRLLHTCVMLFYLLFVLSFLRAGDAYPAYWKAVWAFIGVGTSIALLEQVLGRPEFQVVANLVPLTFLLLGLWGTILAVRDGLHGSRFFMLGFCVLLLGGWMNFMASLPQFAHWNEIFDQLTLLFQATDAMIFGGAILNQMYGLRNERDKAIENQLSEAERRLELNNKLVSTEGNLHHARQLAERHRVTLASTSHDLRQPIASLRMSLEIAKDQTPALVSDLSAGIEFLDTLLAQTLANTRPDAQIDDMSSADTDVVDLQFIMQNAQRMFAMEAAQKSITLKVVDSSLAVQIPVIDLVRIVSNLTSNAVRNTASGGVLIGVRRRDGAAAIEVWDSGAGIPRDQVHGLMEPYVRGPGTGAADGEGLGLSIVKKLVERNGLTLRVQSAPGKGSVFAVEGLRITANKPAALTNK